MKNKHFSDLGTQKAIDEIKKRHNNNYELIIEKIILQIKTFRDNVNRRTKLVIGVSGGIDSAVVACLAKKAVGGENIITVYLPARKKDEGLSYFHTVKEYLELKDIKIMPIEKPTKQIADMIRDYTGEKLDPITEGNIASRIRVNILYAVAKEKNGIVLGTSNRTEFVQGYATKYGTPISCDFGVLDELYKTDVLGIATSFGMPKEIMQRESTTGFFVGQSHEEELGATLVEQDVAAFLLFEKKLSINEIAENYEGSKKYLQEFIEKYKQCYHKRILQSEHVKLAFIKHEPV